MLMLLFYIGDDRYALEGSRVVEVVPRVALKTLHHAPEYIPGLFNYRSRFVPVIDLCHLIQGTPCRPLLSSRIILVNYRQDSPEGDSLPSSWLQRSRLDAIAPHFPKPNEEDDTNREQDNYATLTGSRIVSTYTSQILGLMAEKVTETLNKPETEFVDPGIKLNAAPYLGEMITDEQGMIQFVRVEYLLPESQRVYLLPQQEE